VGQPLECKCRPSKHKHFIQTHVWRALILESSERPYVSPGYTKSPELGYERQMGASILPNRPNRPHIYSVQYFRCDIHWCPSSQIGQVQKVHEFIARSQKKTGGQEEVREPVCGADVFLERRPNLHDREAMTDRRRCGRPDNIVLGYNGADVAEELRRYAEETPRAREWV